MVVLYYYIVPFFIFHDGLCYKVSFAQYEYRDPCCLVISIYMKYLFPLPLLSIYVCTLPSSPPRYIIFMSSFISLCHPFAVHHGCHCFHRNLSFFNLDTGLFNYDFLFPIAYYFFFYLEKTFQCYL